ncbi:MAG: bifunctional precorrin-2 dehydrogenase/sirohydrochlorin ferrochelatase [Armatimonadetes bacterium]|nr:bifunctional precorrin-2 dehydrogenase/sirohydrochlorin ferrochelatase [Armatimonadota bacterium]NCO95963.1 bifunctional precorrin-2 dehydrogenase/sirohydrochlorin ferrochelatase [Armatimonadota bacterium]NCP33905.1 bifunctional precorrin-2 dehydrogenase/sirohydrochlorin ferrochelatase [Armatimonadota bacterium]NCQ29543.1 bifunctional precorrin-2 dehydrogenase/sirohydrochlorin ferrochelatase [Armatimonadota bacterium]NDK13469.1 bifunctional precorrin-2 dehydrogenase/sirohydrochlorin ferroche
MNLYPIELKIAARACLVVGGGNVAERKVASLRECDACVTVVAPALTPALEALARSGDLTVLRRGFVPEDLSGVALCIAATDDPTTNELAYREASARGIPVNVVDQPDLCTFFVPSTIRRGPVSLAISTTGTSPALAKRLRKRLEEIVTPAHGQLAELMGEFRPEVKDRFPNEAARRPVYERMIESEALDLLRQGKRDQAEEVLRACMS